MTSWLTRHKRSPAFSDDSRRSGAFSKKTRKRRPGFSSCERSRPRTSPFSSRRHLSFEPLECRQLLAADVILSEIMYQPPWELNDPEEVGREFIEIHNRGDATADLTGWQFTRGVDYLFPPATLAPGEYLAVPADPAVFAANNTPRLFEYCRRTFPNHEYFAASVAGSSGILADSRGLQMQVPFHVQPRGVVEPLQWIVSRS